MSPIMQSGQTIPDFTLPDPNGNVVSSRSYYMRRSLVVALLPNSPDANWSAWITQLSASMQSLPENDAICLIIIPPSARDIVSGVASGGNSAVRMLIDEDEQLRERFEIQGSDGLLLITDRYGVIFHAAHGSPESPGLGPERVPGWVEFIACRCS